MIADNRIAAAAVLDFPEFLIAKYGRRLSGSYEQAVAQCRKDCTPFFSVASHGVPDDGFGGAANAPPRTIRVYLLEQSRIALSSIPNFRTGSTRWI
jgi:hypothetical protein